jgi:hypothetical protein
MRMMRDVMRETNSSRCWSSSNYGNHSVRDDAKPKNYLKTMCWPDMANNCFRILMLFHVLSNLFRCNLSANSNLQFAMVTWMRGACKFKHISCNLLSISP